MMQMQFAVSLDYNQFGSYWGSKGKSNEKLNNPLLMSLVFVPVNHVDEKSIYTDTKLNFFVK